MLFHVPDISRALGEIRRVLQVNGKFYATTVGENHLSELGELMNESGIEKSVMWAHSFSLENGAAQLMEHFARVERFDFDDGLVVTKAEPLVAYVLSGSLDKTRGVQPDAQLEKFRRVLAERIVRDGAIRITKASGLFVAQGTA